MQDVRFPLYPLAPDTLYVNFGFWDVVRRREPFPSGHHNRLVEHKVAELNGIKSLYSESYYEPENVLAPLRRGRPIRALKSKYDPDGAFKDLYQKCVLRQ